MDKKELLKQFRSPDDKLLFSKVLDRLFLCQSTLEKTFTIFLDPMRAVQFTEIIRNETDERILLFGGAPGCERKMLGFAPAFQQLEYIDFPIDRLSIRFMKKFASGLSHRDFLGSITGLGINREKIGDINVGDGNAAAYVNRDVSGFICANLEHAGRCGVTAAIENIPNDFWEGWQEMHPDDSFEMIANISSPRLDAIISAVFNLPRSSSAKLISSGKVFVNWAPVIQNGKVIVNGDVISVRGYGRARVEAITRGGRKGRYAAHVLKNS